MALSIEQPLVGKTFFDTAIGRTTKEIFEFEPVSSQTKTCEAVKEVLKGITFTGLSALGRVGLYPLTVQLFAGNPVAGNILATTFVTAWGSLALKSYWDLDRSRVALLKLSEGPKTRSAALAETAKVVASIVSGFLAEFPFIYVAYQDNGYNPIYWFTGSGNIIIPSYSCYMTINDVQSRMRFTEEEKKLKIEQRKALNDIARFLEDLPTLPESKVDELSALCAVMKSSTSPDKQVAVLKELLTKTRIVTYMGEERRAPSRCSQWTTLAAATLLSMSQLFWIGYLSYNGWDTITSSQAAGAIFAVISVLINTYYSQELMVENLVAFREALSCRRKKTLAEMHYPALTFGAKALATAVSATAFGTPALISQSLPTPWSYVSMALFCAQNQIAPIVPAARAIDSLVSKYVGGRSADEKTRKVFELHNKMEAFRFMLQHASPRAFEHYENFKSETASIDEPLSRRRTTDWEDALDVSV